MIVSPLSNQWPPSKWPKLFINGGDPNHLLIGMILQVESIGFPHLTQPLKKGPLHVEVWLEDSPHFGWKIFCLSDGLGFHQVSTRFYQPIMGTYGNFLHDFPPLGLSTSTHRPHLKFDPVEVDAFGLLADQRAQPWPDLKCLGDGWGWDGSHGIPPY